MDHRLFLVLATAQLAGCIFTLPYKGERFPRVDVDPKELTCDLEVPVVHLGTLTPRYANSSWKRTQRKAVRVGGNQLCPGSAERKGWSMPYDVADGVVASDRITYEVTTGSVSRTMTSVPPTHLEEACAKVVVDRIYDRHPTMKELCGAQLAASEQKQLVHIVYYGAKSALRDCRAQALQRGEAAPEFVWVRLAIGPDGRVSADRPEKSDVDDALWDCLRPQFESGKFRAVGFPVQLEEGFSLQ